ncbi:hypothetical protein ZWY2020_025703 [Hordeum vulgare]|nr:hypothetical protein ZWY2020_025703 [Hordeum vulgare]
MPRRGASGLGSGAFMSRVPEGQPSEATQNYNQTTVDKEDANTEEPVDHEDVEPAGNEPVDEEVVGNILMDEELVTV